MDQLADCRKRAGFWGAPFNRTSKCRCGPVARPVEPDHLTILRMNVREDDLAARGRDDRGAGLGGKVQAFVKTLLARERIDAPAVARRKPAAVYRGERRQE